MTAKAKFRPIKKFLSSQLIAPGCRHWGRRHFIFLKRKYLPLFYGGNVRSNRHKRGFRVLKSEIEIGPVFHRLPERIKAHASLCFIALILYRVMRQRLKAADSELSPERALEELQRLQHHQIRINHAAKPITGISRLSEVHNRVFAALSLKKPSQPQQLSLL